MSPLLAYLLVFVQGWYCDSRMVPFYLWYYSLIRVQVLYLWSIGYILGLEILLKIDKIQIYDIEDFQVCCCSLAYFMFNIVDNFVFLLMYFILASTEFIEDRLGYSLLVCALWAHGIQLGCIQTLFTFKLFNFLYSSYSYDLEYYFFCRPLFQTLVYILMFYYSFTVI